MQESVCNAIHRFVCAFASVYTTQENCPSCKGPQNLTALVLQSIILINTHTCVSVHTQSTNTVTDEGALVYS